MIKATPLAGPVLVALLAACGGGGSTGGAVAIGDFPNELSAASCQYTFRCCTDAEIKAQYNGLTLAGQPITTEAQCEQLDDGLFAAFLVPEWQASIAKGRMSYDADAAGECISLFDSLACGAMPSQDTLDACVPFLTPLVAGSGACSQSYECTTEYCVGASTGSNGSSTDGACAPKPKLGEPCTSTCDAGLYCDFGSTGELCAMQLGMGQACTANGDCTSGACDTTGTMTCTGQTCTGR